MVARVQAAGLNHGERSKRLRQSPDVVVHLPLAALMMTGAGAQPIKRIRRRLSNTLVHLAPSLGQ
jgi:hypothetical protein